ncbi:50S ribosomal protein L28 [bacterium]|jgi:large subunit ribosomal protein L28|nr:50S ribosomal protein L28 [bacterium]
MARKCTVSKVKPLVGNNVSHSKRRTKRRQEPNLQWKRFWLEDEKRWIRLRVTARILRTISNRGLKATLKKHGMLKQLVGA